MGKSDGKPQGLRVGPQPTPEDPTAGALAQLSGAPGITRTQTGYQTAITVQKPRNLKKVEDAIMYEAAQMGEDFIYSWRQNDKESKEPDGKTTIEGMSIEGAMIMLRNWTNAACEVRLADETPTHFLIEATFIDLEAGFSLPRLYRQRKSGGPGGRMADDRKEDIAFQIAQSKAQRNVIDKSMPFWLKKRAIDAAKSAAAEKYKDVEAWIPRVAAGFAKLGVSMDQLVARIGAPKEGWTPFDLVNLRTIFQSITDRESTVVEEFPPPANVPVDQPITTQGAVVEEKPAAAATPPATSTAAPVPSTPTPGVPVETKPQETPVPQGAVVVDAVKPEEPPKPVFEPPKPRVKKQREPGEEG